MVKQRENSRWIGERKNNEGRLLCLVPTCNNLRQKHKISNRTRNYCSNHSFRDMRQFTTWAVLRRKVLERDNYKCVKCGTKETFKLGISNLVADHILAIALGGNEWDINNIETLCNNPCNKIKTANDAKEIAKLRRSEKLISISQKQLVEVVT